MKLKIDTISRTCPEAEIFEALLSLDQQNILELGCGDAHLTRLIATTGHNRQITATEVDTIQHNNNLQIKDLPNVSFIFAGSEKIPAEDNSFDCVLMFKSFHHIPIDLMAQALEEIKRVSKQGALVYISEPLFSGEFNEILRLFHNEEQVREAAFSHIKQAVADKLLSLEKEIFFNTPVVFESFADYEQKVMAATHSNHQLSDELYYQVKQKFDQSFERNGGHFVVPIRVDLLKVI